MPVVDGQGCSWSNNKGSMKLYLYNNNDNNDKSAIPHADAVYCGQYAIMTCNLVADFNEFKGDKDSEMIGREMLDTIAWMKSKKQRLSKR